LQKKLKDDPLLYQKAPYKFSDKTHKIITKGGKIYPPNESIAVQLSQMRFNCTKTHQWATIELPATPFPPHCLSHIAIKLVNAQHTPAAAAKQGKNTLLGHCSCATA